MCVSLTEIAVVDGRVQRVTRQGIMRVDIGARVQQLVDHLARAVVLLVVSKQKVLKEKDEKEKKRSN